VGDNPQEDGGVPMKEGMREETLKCNGESNAIEEERFYKLPNQSKTVGEGNISCSLLVRTLKSGKKAGTEK